MTGTRRAVALLLGLAVCVWLPPTVSWADQTADETALGAQAAKDIEAHYRVVNDPAMVERLKRVGDVLVRVVERQDLTYKFKVLDIPGVNALGVPGGWVYVTKGMMKFIRTDDELAAVLAHELTHINHRHYYVQQSRQNGMMPALAAALILSILAHSAAPVLGVSVATRGALANYQRDLERDADLTGVTYLTKTGYSSVAMLTLMEHLDQMDKLTGQPDLGPLYQDHPRPDERVSYIQDDLRARGIPIIRRIPEGYLALSLEPSAPAAGEPVTVLVDGRPVIQLGATVQGQPPLDRAQALAATLSAFFNTDPAPYDVRAVGLQGQWSVFGGQLRLFEATPQDAAYAKGSPQAVAEQLRGRLAEVLAAALYNRKF
jgi:Zn-dependent protease with chaperone function